MTELQKKQFINWLDAVAEAKTFLNKAYHVGIKGLKEWAGLCEVIQHEEAHLDDAAFKYAVECLNPTIIKEHIKSDSYNYYRYSFEYKGILFFTIERTEDE